MSAAEKLKALSVSHAIDWPAPSYEAYRLAEDQERLRKNAIDRALPQIVAVVEAAETCAPILHNALGAAGMNMTPGHLLDDALAALDSLVVGDES